MPNHPPSAIRYTLIIAWLYPDLMSTYGDRGNIIVLSKRCEWRGIKVELKRITVETEPNELKDADIIFMGGAQDTQQEIVNEDLFKNKGKILSEKINAGIPGLFICGAYQFLGKYYKTAEGKILPGLGLLPVYTENPGEDHPRLIENIVTEAKNGKWKMENGKCVIVGFENHGGRTYLDEGAKPFAKVIHGFGNNGKDKTEGIFYQNAIGTYLHGPILPKNPEIADWLITKALETKYKKEVELEPIDDILAKKAKEGIMKRLG
jgi:lipid II isoglutaminyl synthase (glutamine-hydrolysing)